MASLLFCVRDICMNRLQHYIYQWRKSKNKKITGLPALLKLGPILPYILTAPVNNVKYGFMKGLLPISHVFKMVHICLAAVWRHHTDIYPYSHLQTKDLRVKHLNFVVSFRLKNKTRESRSCHSSLLAVQCSSDSLADSLKKYRELVR